MTCDDVFAILTRGPFPSGERHDRMVELHLQLCPACQRLAEALRPNDDRRPESIAPEDSMALPGYWGGPLHLESQPAVSLTQMAGKNRPQSKASPVRTVRKPSYGVNIWHFTAAVALGIIIAAILRTLVGVPDRGAMSIASNATGTGYRNAGGAGGYGNLPEGYDDRRWANADHWLQTENRIPADKLPQQCPRKAASFRDYSPLLNGEYSAAQALRLGQENCCHNCHRTGETKLLGDDDDAILRVHRSCNACH